MTKVDKDNFKDEQLATEFDAHASSWFYTVHLLFGVLSAG
jgi:hypothetical protein